MDYMVFIIFMVVYCPNDQILAHRFRSNIGPCDYDGDDDDDDVTLYVILLGRCISTNLVQRERAQFKQKIAVLKILMIINSGNPYFKIC